jgi:PAS domain S-box-containing protein
MDRFITSGTAINFERRMVEAAIDSAVNAILIIDAHGIVQKANPATVTLFGFALDEIVGRNVSMLMPDPHRAAHDGYIANYLRTKEKKIIGIGRQVEGRRKNGEVFPMHLSVGEFEADGNRYFVGTIHDMSARVAAQHESARQRTFFEAIFNNCPDAMIISNAEGRITLCNPAATRIFGRKAEDLAGQPLRKLFAGEADYASFAQIARAVLPSGLPGGNVIDFARENGERFPGLAATADITSGDGRHMGFLAVIRDVSREVAQDQALRQVQRMEALGQLTGGIAHDFNNLLTIITGNLELLELDLEGEEPRDLLKRAHDAATMGARLTDRLLTFARRRPLDAVLIDLNEQLLGMMDLLRRSLGETVSIASSFAPDLWPVRSDVGEIENAVLNLAINARDAMPSGGELLIETGNLELGDPAMAAELGLAEGDYVRLSVSDTGHGIEPEHLARVFEPFFTTKEAGRGTGLGLSVIYGFARQSGGRVTIQSQPGEGTAVTLYLPRAAAESAGPARRGGASPASTASGEVILVVEDQEPVREVTMKRLARLGYRTREADSAVAAIELLRSGEKVDLIFSDVVMPGGLTGFDLAEWAAINHPGLPVLLTSGFSESIAQGLTGERGAVAVLRKPYSGEDLAAAIRAALDQARATSGVKT